MKTTQSKNRKNSHSPEIPGVPFPDHNPFSLPRSNHYPAHSYLWHSPTPHTCTPNTHIANIPFQWHLGLRSRGHECPHGNDIVVSSDLVSSNSVCHLHDRDYQDSRVVWALFSASVSISLSASSLPLKHLTRRDRLSIMSYSPFSQL